MIEDYVGQEPDLAAVRCEVLDTGLDTPTGGRVKQAGDLIGDERFMLTYVDGLADVDLNLILDYHDSHGGLATMTTVRPNLQWGVARIGPGGAVEEFVEKPRVEEWINGGFLCLDAAALEYIGPDDVFEEEPLRRLAAAGELMAYRHEGFWDCVDTYKDLVAVNDLWDQGGAPWLKSS